MELASGARVTADYVVLATGSTHRYPAKIDVPDSARGKDRLRGTHQALAAAGDVLLLGAGPVGLEFAGEIKAAWPDKRVTLGAQLADLGVDLLLGTSLRDKPPTAPGELGAFTAVTESGVSLRADIWFACHGAAPAVGYLAPDLLPALTLAGQVAVTPELRLPGQAAVFAIATSPPSRR